VGSEVICRTCLNRRARTESKAGGHALIWGCVTHKIRFGYQFEYEEGKNMRTKCAEYLKGTVWANKQDKSFVLRRVKE
jgi:hypothetical protein